MTSDFDHLTRTDLQRDPVRLELLDFERLQERARTLASEHIKMYRKLRRRTSALARLRNNDEFITEAVQQLTADVRERRPLEPASEWLLDNHHLVHGEIQTLRRDLPPTFYRELPQVVDGSGHVAPRVYAAALSLLAHTDSRIDSHNLTAFLIAYQTITPLTLGELWAWPSALRMALIENLRRVAGGLVVARNARREADAVLEQAEKEGAAAEIHWPAIGRTSFAGQVLERLRAVGSDHATALRNAVTSFLSSQELSAHTLILRDHQRRAAAQVLTANIITSLRVCASLDWTTVVETISHVENVLRRDPSGVYDDMDFKSRDQQRRAVERLAPSDGEAQVRVALKAIELADAHVSSDGDARSRHVGYYLVGGGRDLLARAVTPAPTAGEHVSAFARRHVAALYIGSIAAITGVLLVWALWLLSRAGAPTSVSLALIAAFTIPLSELAGTIVNRIVAAGVQPTRLPRLSLAEGIPSDGRTMVIVPTLLTSAASVEALLEQIEVSSLANPDPNILFAILSDFTDSLEPTHPGDAALLQAASDGIRALEKKYGSARYFLFHRERRWNEAEGVWMGWERKRGKIEEFNQLLRGARHTSYSVQIGRLDLLPGVRYCLTLDADTRLPRETVRSLVGIIMHPLNAPRIDSREQRVVEGYSILQPRVSVTMSSAAGSTFARLYAGHTGVDPYTTAVSDVYQDLFDEGIFTGKGLYDVDSFTRVLENRVPENRLLSHDLFEGLYARAALVTDVEVVDDYPSSVLAHARRRHRWVRGDWQILGWLFPWVPAREGMVRNTLPAISRWKILDNLRRSLVAPSTLVALVLAWLALPEPVWLWTVAALAAIATPLVIAWGEALWRFVVRGQSGTLAMAIVGDAAEAFGRAGLDVVLLAQTTYDTLHAVGLTLVRLAVTRRRMLEWETAAATTARYVGRSASTFVTAMLPSSGIAVVIMWLVSTFRQSHTALAAPFVVGWVLAPFIGHALSRRRSSAQAELSDADRQYLRTMAQEHWLFFSTYTTEEHHYLPPDNVQFRPDVRVAPRTSPTNIAMALLSTLAARDFGFIDQAELVDRLERVFATLDKLTHYQGHLLNWYDTQTLTPLEPRYVSTVDSGNLAGALWTLAAALEKASDHTRNDTRSATAHGGAEAVAHETAGGSTHDSKLHFRCRSLANRATAYVEAMDFNFLFDPTRELFATGYRLSDIGSDGRLDSSYYDLLASEARLASFIAIAKGDVPMRHWFRLGRRVTSLHGVGVLVSWSGTMFEYLMPELIMRAFPETLLSQSCAMAVRAQIDYGKRLGIPWGISESAYAATDRQHTYQYKAFGVPELGLSRSVGAENVVSPYSTALAIRHAASEAVANLKRLAALGVRGEFGFFEALDYRVAPENALTSSKVRVGTPVVVRACMSHHHGMALVAIANALCGDVMVRRFHTNKLVRAAELLLQERIPRQVAPETGVMPEAVDDSWISPVAMIAVRRYRDPNTPVPHAQVLSNGSLVSTVSLAGGGAMQWQGRAVTRNRIDPTTDRASQAIYIHDVRSGAQWSATHLPMGVPADDYEVTFQSDKAVFFRRDGDIATRMEVAVSPEDDVEVRRLVVHNRGARIRELEITSYAELSLATPQDDFAHPAFAKLFVETQFLPEDTALLCRRRPRTGPDECWAFHVLSLEGRAQGSIEWETDRAKFIGRRRSLRRPWALEDHTLSGTTGAVLDPICSLRVRIRLLPGQRIRLAFATGISAHEQETRSLARKYHHPTAAGRTLALAFTHAQSLQEHLALTGELVRTFDRLASCLFFADYTTRADDAAIERNVLGQSALWRFGISGDLPLVVVRVPAGDVGMTLVANVLRAWEYWRLKGAPFDVVVLNEHETGYFEEAQTSLSTLLASSAWSQDKHAPGAVFLLKKDQMSADEFNLIRAVARVVFVTDAGTLAVQLEAAAIRAKERLDARPSGRAVARRTADQGATGELPALPSITLPVGLGGFTSPTGFRLTLEPGTNAPMPWCNVMANQQFGTIVSEAGSAFTWAVNSRENRLTRFENDPITDATAEAFFIRDDQSDQCWCPTPGPVRADRDSAITFDVHHAPGVSRFDARAHDIASRLETFVHTDEPVKFSVLTLHNRSARTRLLSVYGYCEWWLGPPRNDQQLHVVTDFDQETGIVLARNSYSQDFGSMVAFFAVDSATVEATGDRGEFLGRNGSIDAPEALDGRPLTTAFGERLDPCAVIRQRLSLEAGQRIVMVFVLGVGADRKDAIAKGTHFRNREVAQAALAAVVDLWSRRLEAVTVRTPDDSFDAIMNGWLLYQTLACRVFAKSGYYQPGGAYGFRDQLQDVLALCHADPAITRKHLLRVASRQFVEGDVQHWWHEPSGRGLRSRCSDDLLWLPYAVADYVSITGDSSVLDESVPYLSGTLLADGADESYELPHASGEVGSVLDHCIRAVRRGHTSGRQGLPLFGSSDWNDGMNRVGHKGQGESTWLGFFLHDVLNRTAWLCDVKGRSAEAAGFRHEASRLIPALEASWDGQWFRRGYYDDGTPLGSALSDECRIDSLPQSWAMLSGAVARPLAQRAMDAVRSALVSRHAATIGLLTPAFDKTPHDPGYIKGYPPGIRENGGQYTHAAVWFVMALAMLDAGDEAMELFHLLNPVNHARNGADVERYKLEPYVIAGDVYTHPEHQGRGGWSWYTGSAGWMYRLGLEHLLGCRRNGNMLMVDPCIPSGWPAFSLTLKVSQTTYEIAVNNPDGVCRGVRRARLDGQRVDARRIPLVLDDRVHHVTVEMGSTAEESAADRETERTTSAATS